MARPENPLLKTLKKWFGFEEYTGMTVEHIEEQIKAHGSGSHIQPGSWDTRGTNIRDPQPQTWLNSQTTKPSRVFPPPEPRGEIILHEPGPKGQLWLVIKTMTRSEKIKFLQQLESNNNNRRYDDQIHVVRQSLKDSFPHR